MTVKAKIFGILLCLCLLAACTPSVSAIGLETDEPPSDGFAVVKVFIESLAVVVSDAVEFESEYYQGVDTDPTFTMLTYAR